MLVAAHSVRYDLRDNAMVLYWWSNSTLPPCWLRHDDDERRIHVRLRVCGGTSQFFAQSIQNLHIFYSTEVPH